MTDSFQPKFADLVRNFSSTTGTGDFILGGAPTGFESFGAALQPGDQFYYSAIGIDRPDEREVGRGTLNADGSIARVPVGGTLTNFSPGTKSIALVAAAEWFEAASELVGVIAPTGKALLGAATPADARDALEISGGFNVKWFGAKGDGIADDTAAIQAALDHVDSLGGGTVYFPEGTYKQTSYLTLHSNTVVRGAGRRASKLVATHAGGGGATPGESIRNGSNFYSAYPINTTTNAHITIENLWIQNTNPANVGAGVYQQSGVWVLLRSLEVLGQKYPLVFDQTENLVVDHVQASTTIAGGIATWIVNGDDLTPEAMSGYTNTLTFRDFNINCSTTAYGVIDDGGHDHNFVGGTYNCGINAIRLAGGNGTQIVGIYAESQTEEIVRLDSASFSGRPVGGSFVTIIGGQFTPMSGQGSIKGHGSPGSLNIIGGSWGPTTASSLVNGPLFYSVSITGPGLAGYPAVAFADGSAINHFEAVRVGIKSNGSVGVKEDYTTHGGAYFVPGAGAGFLETCNMGGARQSYGFFLAGTTLQFGIDGIAKDYQFLAPLSATGKIGYSTGAGGSVTQATNRTTGVTLNKCCGQITLASAAGSPSWSTFTVTNSQVAATDVVRVVQASGADKYIIGVTGVRAGAFDISCATTGGTTTEQPVFNFAVLKGVAA